MLRALRRIGALRRLSRHERWRAHLKCPAQNEGEIYCRCAQCKRDRQRYHANAHGPCVKRVIVEALGLMESPRYTRQHVWLVSGWSNPRSQGEVSRALTCTCTHCGREILAAELEEP